MQPFNWRKWASLGILTMMATLSPIQAQVNSNTPSPGPAFISRVPGIDTPFDQRLISDHAGDPAAVNCQACSDEQSEACPGAWFVDGEYLLQKPRRRAQDFAIIDPLNQGSAAGSIESVNWDTSSGFRIGGGYRFPGEGWELGVFYTNLHSHQDRLLMAPPDGTLFATLTHPGFISQVDSAQANTGLNYNIVDVEAGRRWIVGDSCQLRLYGGGRYAWIDQNFDVVYDGGDASLAQVTSPIEFTGGGLRIGGEANWHVFGGFSLFARASGSLLVGEFRTRLTETDGNGTVVNVNVSEKFRKTVPVTELGMGINWEYRNLQIRVGYDMTNWFNMVDSPDFVSDVSQGKLTHRTGDLNLDGLILQVGMSF